MNKIHCCERLFNNLHDKNLPFGYSNKVREFFLNYLDSEFTVQLIHYCPWCGMKFPQSLRNQYFEILEKEYGLEPDIFDIDVDPRIPKEFKSDEWWKKRGL